MAKIVKNGRIYNGGTASEISFNNTGTDLNAIDVQNAIIEVEDKIPTVPDHYSADDITYNNATSGLAATTVQAAIDELSSSVRGSGVRATLLSINKSTYTESNL